MNISDFYYELPEEQIARFPLGARDASRLLVWQDGEISETGFAEIDRVLPAGSLLVFNNTRVVRARLVMHKPAADSPNHGARIEVFCLEPCEPADYERAFSIKGRCEWKCMVGGLKKWKSGPVNIHFTHDGSIHTLLAWWAGEQNGGEQIVRFEWNADLSFGELLDLLGRVPIPPYLNRDSEDIDNTRYQTVYAAVKGSVAAPTAGLHFTSGLIERLRVGGVETDEVTLHVGAGTFLPVKVADVLEHSMHTEHFEVTLATLDNLIEKRGRVIAVGTTSVRTLESLAALAWRIERSGGPTEGDPELGRPVGQFEPYNIPAEFDGAQALETLIAWTRARGLEKISAATRIMITPAGFQFRIVNGIITNFHQPCSTLLLLVAAFTGGGEWRRIYDHALAQGFRFLSYGDSSLLLR
ncbi:MAG: S-adenosylmethionine:tRNA ribosyltransferase-isomerase [Alistipes sp.]|jgi:S-adenosylmethionine:tRNA ribosyltransferase-isomerase|nr:S-adenosylmethionine:tRNA ribosyltransferase-isomerase [Alistipes sp.]